MTVRNFSVLAVVVVLTFNVNAPVATANSYNVYACYAGQGTYLNPEHSAASWTLANNNGANYYLPYDHCGGSTGFGVISRSGYTAPAGDEGEVSFQAPEGLHIRQVQLWRSLIDYGIGEGGTSQRNYAWNLADGELPSVGDEFEGTANVPYGAVGSGETTNNGIIPSNYLSVNLAAALPSQFAYVIGCDFEKGCPTGGQNPDVPSGFDTVLSIYGAIVTVEDNNPPTLSLSNTGLLDGSTQSGTVPLTLNAAATPGIAKFEIYADNSSTPAFTQNFTQMPNCQFWEAIPCQNLKNYQYPVDTTKLPNGTYYITVKAYDPAGNVVASSSPSPVTVQNGTSAPSSTQIGPGSPLALRGAPNGTNASDQAKLTARWARTPKTALTGRYGTRERITGTVTTTAGQPISGASLDVSEVPADQGAKAVPLARTSTGPTGAWTLALPANISSATLSFAYRSHVNDTVPVATAALRLGVHAGLTLHIAPRVTSVGRKVFFSGALHGAPIPPGKQLVLEASSGGEWIQFDTIGTDAKGHYHASYRFKFPGPVTYKFRVVSPYQSNFPFLSGTSNNVAVHEL